MSYELLDIFSSYIFVKTFRNFADFGDGDTNYHTSIYLRIVSSDKTALEKCNMLHMINKNGLMLKHVIHFKIY